jgi:hypothetical protein
MWYVTRDEVTPYETDGRERWWLWTDGEDDDVLCNSETEARAKAASRSAAFPADAAGGPSCQDRRTYEAHLGGEAAAKALEQAYAQA